MRAPGIRPPRHTGEHNVYTCPYCIRDRKAGLIHHNGERVQPGVTCYPDSPCTGCT